MKTLIKLAVVASALTFGAAAQAGEAEQQALQAEIDTKVQKAESAGLQPTGDDVKDITIDILDKKVEAGETTLEDLEPTYGHYITPEISDKLKLKSAIRIVDTETTAESNGGGTEIGKGNDG